MAFITFQGQQVTLHGDTPSFGDIYLAQQRPGDSRPLAMADHAPDGSVYIRLLEPAVGNNDVPVDIVTLPDLPGVDRVVLANGTPTGVYNVDNTAIGDRPRIAHNYAVASRAGQTVIERRGPGIVWTDDSGHLFIADHDAASHPWLLSVISTESPPSRSDFDSIASVTSADLAWLDAPVRAEVQRQIDKVLSQVPAASGPAEVFPSFDPSLSSLPTYASMTPELGVEFADTPPMINDRLWCATEQSAGVQTNHVCSVSRTFCEDRASFYHDTLGVGICKQSSMMGRSAAGMVLSAVRREDEAADILTLVKRGAVRIASECTMNSYDLGLHTEGDGWILLNVIGSNRMTLGLWTGELPQQTWHMLYAGEDEDPGGAWLVVPTANKRPYRVLVGRCPGDQEVPTLRYRAFGMDELTAGTSMSAAITFRR